MVLISTVTFVISTIDELQQDEKGRVEYPTILAIIEYIDNFVVVFFTLEYFVRLIVAPRKLKFMIPLEGKCLKQILHPDHYQKKFQFQICRQGSILSGLRVKQMFIHKSL